MHLRVINREEAIQICLRSENQFFDRKSKKIEPRSLQKIACAFANSDGGEIAIGIEDTVDRSNPLKSWDGFEKTEDADPLIQAIIKNIKPAIDFRYEFLKIDGDMLNIILLVNIERSIHVHETADQVIYERSNSSSNKVVGLDNITRLKYSKGVHSAEEEIIDDEDLTVDLIESCYFKDFRSQLPSSQSDDLIYLKKLGLIDNNFKPKYVAVLLFHPYPCNVLPRQCSVKVVRYDTSQEDPERENLKDRIPVEGPAYDLIHKSYQEIKSMLSQIKIWHIDGPESPKYPDEAIWEVLTNSIIHRDYSVSDNVQISIYNDRIDFKSPGRLPAYVKPTEILKTRYSRNPKLVISLSRYKNPPNKEIGEGMNTTFQSIQKAGLVPPLIMEDGGYFVVTLSYKKSTDHADLVEKFIKKHGGIKNQQARELLGLRYQSEAYAILERMKHDGRIEFLNNQWVAR